MTISVLTTLHRRNLLPAEVMNDPYTEDRNGVLYLVTDHADGRTAFRCDAIVSVDFI